MIYSCKVFTPEFKAKFDAYIEQVVNDKLIERGIPEDKRSLAAAFATLEERSGMYYMWNDADRLMVSSPILYEYYNPLGLWTPEYTTIELVAQERGLQSHPRVMWNGKIMKIDDIDDIISFKTLDMERV